jgi:hypothetical protein
MFEYDLFLDLFRHSLKGYMKDSGNRMTETGKNMFEFAQNETGAYLEDILRPLSGKARLRTHTMRNTAVSRKWGRETPAKTTSHMLVLVKSGQGAYEVNGETLPLKRGRVLFIGDGCDLAYHQDPDHRPTLIGAHFS